MMPEPEHIAQCGNTEIHEAHGRCAGLDGTEVER